MDYETFKRELLCALRRQAGEGVSVNTDHIPKNNGVMQEGLVIRSEDSHISPTFFARDIYRQIHEQDFDYDELAAKLLKIAVRQSEKMESQVSCFQDFYRARDNIFVHVINARWNAERLKKLPHQNVLDLAVVCSYRIQGETLGNAMVLIDEDQTESWGITPQQLLALGKANTARKYPVSLISINELIDTVAREEGLVPCPEIPEDDRPMYILTNTEKYYGAYSLFYPNVQQHVADVLNSSYFVLPSSIHETILLPDSGLYTPKELQEMVKSVNQTQVDPRETLSDAVYYYDRKTKCLSIVAEGE